MSTMSARTTLRSIVAGGALAATVATGTPAALAEAPDARRGIAVTTTQVDDTTVVETDAGSLTVEDGVFAIKAADGTVMAGTELSFRVDDFRFPIAAEITDRRAVLRPLYDIAHASYEPVSSRPHAEQAPWRTEYERENAAFARLGATLALGASIGTLVGGVTGGAIGCALSIMVGCLPGLLPGAGMGTVLGQILITAPIAIFAAVQYFETVNAPMPSRLR